MNPSLGTDQGTLETVEMGMALIASAVDLKCDGMQDLYLPANTVRCYSPNSLNDGGVPIQFRRRQPGEVTSRSFPFSGWYDSLGVDIHSL